MMLDRALERGRRAVILDPKGEYAALARSFGVDVVALGRDGWCSPFPANDRESRDLFARARRQRSRCLAEKRSTLRHR